MEHKNGKDTKILLWFLVMAILFTGIINVFFAVLAKQPMQEVSYDVFVKALAGGEVSRVEILPDRLIFVKKDAEDYYYTGNVGDRFLFEKLDKANVTYKAPVADKHPIFDFVTTWVLPSLLLYVIFNLFTSSIFKKFGGSALTFGKNTAKIYAQKETGISFCDVAGQEEAKEALWEMVDFLHNPEKYKHVGARLPKGALLMGPPGTGKTLLAKAIAGEARVPFFSLTGSDFVEMFAGVGAARVRDLFKQAEENAPCIIFIDELDALGKARELGGSGNDEREQTLNQLLSEMDGFDASRGVVILGATNRPEVLDKALLRPGRFDRQVIVDKPDVEGRLHILQVHTKRVRLEKKVDLKQLAYATSGCVGADLENIVNEAALRAVRLHRTEVRQEDFLDALETVFAGREKRGRVLSEEERRVTAYHEIGHALAGAILAGNWPLQKITIVPRTLGALGYTLSLAEEDRNLLSREELYGRMTTLLAGRAAEEVIFEIATTGATNDIEQATMIARNVVAKYGMTERFDMVGLSRGEGRFLEGQEQLTCSEATAAAVDEEVLRIIRYCHEEAKALLLHYTPALHNIAGKLLEKETLSGQEFRALLEEEKRKLKQQMLPFSKKG